MSHAKTLRRIVIPQAMRVIVPPTGNEFINMLKTSSLAYAVQYYELLRSAQDIGQTSGAVVEMLFVAAAWYLVLTTVFSVGQYYLERHYARGSSRSLPPTPVAEDQGEPALRCEPLRHDGRRRMSRHGEGRGRAQVLRPRRTSSRASTWR